MSSWQNGDRHSQQRPVGSRRHDVGRPDAFGVAPMRDARPGVARRLLSVLLLLAALAVIALIGWVVFSFVGGSGSNANVKPGTKVRITIPAGSTPSQVAHILATKGIVRRESVFRARMKLAGDGANFKSGSYVIPAGASYDSIVRVINKGPVAAPTFSFTIPEGQRLEETAAYIDKQRAASTATGAEAEPRFTGAEYLKAVRALRPDPSMKAPSGTTSMEGMLFPATYQLKMTATAQDLVNKQVQAFQDEMSQLNMARAAKANLSPYDVVIIASLIEREAAVAKERPLIAAVIWNRLKVGEPLGIDASNQYGVYKQGSTDFWTTNLTESQLKNDSPYNVRTRQGLPPTPIAEPSAASLEAAANPANVDYRYYKAKGDGSGEHNFTSDYNQFLAWP